MQLLSTLLAIVAGVFLCGGVFALARRRSGYSHVRDTISELGEHGAADSQLVAYGLFLPVGLMQLVIAAMMSNLDDGVALLALCLGIGYLVSVVASCDPGSPMTGSFRQSVHNVGGAVQYCGGAVALWSIAEGQGSLFSWGGWFVTAGLIAISIPGIPIRGLVQRLVETTLFGCLFWACWRIAG